MANDQEIQRIGISFGIAVVAAFFLGSIALTIIAVFVAARLPLFDRVTFIGSIAFFVPVGLYYFSSTNPQFNMGMGYIGGMTALNIIGAFWIAKEEGGFPFDLFDINKTFGFKKEQERPQPVEERESEQTSQPVSRTAEHEPQPRHGPQQSSASAFDVPPQGSASSGDLLADYVRKTGEQ